MPFSERRTARPFEQVQKGSTGLGLRGCPYGNKFEHVRSGHVGTLYGQAD